MNAAIPGNFHGFKLTSLSLTDVTRHCSKARKAQPRSGRSLGDWNSLFLTYTPIPNVLFDFFGVAKLCPETMGTMNSQYRMVLTITAANVTPLESWFTTLQLRCRCGQNYVACVHYHNFGNRRRARAASLARFTLGCVPEWHHNACRSQDCNRQYNR